MDNDNFPGGNQNPEIHNIKTEVPDIEDNRYSHEENQVQSYAAEEIKIEDTRLSKYECNVCGAIFSDEFILAEHTKALHQNSSSKDSDLSTGQEENVKLYKCAYPNCEKAFGNLCYLSRHVLVHSDKKSYKCNIADCTKSFKWEKDLKDHITAHSDENKFCCSFQECGKKYKYSSNLRSHMRSHHSSKDHILTNKSASGSSCREKRVKKLKGEEIGEKKECEEIVVKNEYSSSEETSIKMEEDPLKCTESEEEQNGMELFACGYLNCGQVFRLLLDLETHARSHSVRKPFKCAEKACEKTFKTERELNSHRTVHRNDKPFICSHQGCPKAFKSNSILRRHMLLHGEDAPFKCSYVGCGKTFKRKFYLTSHQTTHSPYPKKFVCDYDGCKKSFPARNKLIFHKEAHSGIIYRCSYENCTKTFKSSNLLSVHLVRHRKKQMK